MPTTYRDPSNRASGVRDTERFCLRFTVIGTVMQPALAPDSDALSPPCATVSSANQPPRHTGGSASVRRRQAITSLATQQTPDKLWGMACHTDSPVRGSEQCAGRCDLHAGPKCAVD